MTKKRYNHVRTQLMKLIGNQKLAGNKLPPEAYLAEKLGVSRGTIREAMQTLVSEGIISKKHGEGNFVHKSAMETKMRIDTTQDFLELIENGGYTARMEKIAGSREIVIGDDFFHKTAPLLGVGTKEELRTLQSVFFADDRPAIYSQVFLSQEIILDNPDKKVVNTLFEFLEEFCSQKVDQTVIYFEPAAVNSRQAKILDIGEGTPIIMWEEYYYNLYDEVICTALTYFNPSYMHLSMLRKANSN